jgi:glycosyltransferase involved in cell wall biosynthesis
MKCSIIIPVYNGSNYLASAIDSAFAQNADGFEVIVVDDGSIDNGKTKNILMRYKNSIKVIYHLNNKGVSAALNSGIKTMMYPFFSWLSHDDIYLPNRLNFTQINFDITENNLVYIQNYKYIDSKGNNINLPVKLKPGRYNGRDMLMYIFSGYNVHGCAVTFNKNILDHVGMFDEDLKFIQDIDMWIRMALYGCSFVVSDEVAILSRLHSNQGSNKYNDFKIEFINFVEKITRLLLNSYHQDRMLKKQFLVYSLKHLEFRDFKLLLNKMFGNKNKIFDAGFILFYFILRTIYQIKRSIKSKII